MALPIKVLRTAADTTALGEFTPSDGLEWGGGAAIPSSDDVVLTTVLTAHTSRTDNPHTVTAAQVGAYTTGAVDTLLAGYAPLASPTFTGTVTAPTGTLETLNVVNNTSANINFDRAGGSGYAASMRFLSAGTLRAVVGFLSGDSSSNFRIRRATGSAGSEVVSDVLVFATTTGIATFSSAIVSGGSITPATDNTHSNGTSSLRWSDTRTVLLTVSGAATFGSTATIAGNLGLGTTDIEAWYTSYRAIQFGGTGAGNASVAAVMAGPALHLIDNAYFDGSWKYRGPVAAAASQIDLTVGAIRFRVAPSGAADTAITWSEVLKADYSGAARIGFYGTTPVAKQTGVAVTAAGIHAALVSLGLIAA